MGQDICAIDRNMREILKHITNVAKMAPLEPLAPLTPVTPSVSTKSKFSFDFSDMTLNDPNGHDTKDTDGSIETESPQLSDNSTNIENEISRGSSVGKLRPVPMNRTSGGYNNAKRRSSLQVPLLLNPHELVTRRYSDGTEDKKKVIFTGISASKSDTNFVSKTPAFVECRKEPLKMDRREDSNVNLKGFKGSDKSLERDCSDFMNSLEDVHSPTCKSPLLGRQLSNSCDNALNRDTDNADSLVRKSSTFSGFQKDSIPDVTSDTKIQDEIESSQKCCSFGNSRGDIPNASPKSKSCFEISQKQTKPQPFVKTKSQGFLETEFGAKTPNEVRTVHFLADQISPTSDKTTDKGKDIELEQYKNEQEIVSDVAICNWINNDYNKGVPSSPGKPSSFDKESQIGKLTERFKDSSQENLRTDSGNVSLQDTPESKHVISDDNLEFHMVNEHDRSCKGGLQFAEKQTNIQLVKDVSPDSLTDISESLKTDSLRTDDDTVLDIETDPVSINGVLGRILEGSSMRSTNL